MCTCFTCRESGRKEDMLLGQGGAKENEEGSLEGYPFCLDYLGASVPVSGHKATFATA